MLTFNIALEAIPVDLQRNFTLMRELDGYAQGLNKKEGKQVLTHVCRSYRNCVERSHLFD